jgi:hypothetical protein
MLNSPFGGVAPTNKDDILKCLHRFNKDLAEFKDGGAVIIPQRVKILMDLAERTHNP